MYMKSYDFSSLISITNNLGHDGIDDGDELNYWQGKLKNMHPDWDNNTINYTSISYCKNPCRGGDNITDGKEINGYNVKIITGILITRGW